MAMNVSWWNAIHNSLAMSARSDRPVHVRQILDVDAAFASAALPGDEHQVLDEVEVRRLHMQ